MLSPATLTRGARVNFSVHPLDPAKNVDFSFPGLSDKPGLTDLQPIWSYFKRCEPFRTAVSIDICTYNVFPSFGKDFDSVLNNALMVIAAVLLPNFAYPIRWPIRKSFSVSFGHRKNIRSWRGARTRLEKWSSVWPCTPLQYIQLCTWSASLSSSQSGILDMIQEKISQCLLFHYSCCFIAFQISWFTNSWLGLGIFSSATKRYTDCFHVRLRATVWLSSEVHLVWYSRLGIMAFIFFDVTGIFTSLLTEVLSFCIGWSSKFLLPSISEARKLHLWNVFSKHFSNNYSALCHSACLRVVLGEKAMLHLSSRYIIIAVYVLK